jgi:hypothetical protein
VFNLKKKKLWSLVLVLRIQKISSYAVTMVLYDSMKLFLSGEKRIFGELFSCQIILVVCDLVALTRKE